MQRDHQAEGAHDEDQHELARQQTHTQEKARPTQAEDPLVALGADGPGRRGHICFNG